MRYDLGGIRFEPGVEADADGIFWYVNELDGWDSPEMRQTLLDRVGDHGQMFAESYVGQRSMVMSGWADVPNRDGFWIARNKLNFATSFINSDGTLTVYEPNVTKRMTVRLGGRLRMRNSPDFLVVEFEVPLIAPDPRKYDNTETNVVLGAGGNVSNIGNFETRPIVELTGPTSNPVTLSFDQAPAVKLNIALTAGQTLVIDSANKTVTMGGVNRYDVVDGSSIWFILLVGNHRFDTTSGSIRVRFRSAWL